MIMTKPEPEVDTVVSVPPHPLGLKPLGNQYTAPINLKDNLGTCQRLPDELLILLLEHLNSSSLRYLGSTCKALFAFTRSDDLWKTIFIDW